MVVDTVRDGEIKMFKYNIQILKELIKKQSYFP